MPHIRQKAAAVGAALALAVTGGIVVAQPAVGAPVADAAPAEKPDYFAEAFPGLRENSVFTPVTYERFERLLDTEGTFAFLIGGPADPTTKAAISHIDAVAQEYGVDTVYTFDPRLDGKEVDIRSFGTGALGEQLRSLYQALPDSTGAIKNPGLVDGYLNKDTTPEFGVAATDPYLFVYDKSHKLGGAVDRVIDSLGGTVTASQLASDAGRESYRDQVGEVFAALDDGAVDEQSQFEFFSTAVNEKHKGQYPDAALYGGDIFGAADESGFRLQSITYPELKLLLESEGKHTILFGGTWCHNTRAVIKDVNRAANTADVDTVYVFDLRLDGVNGDHRHIRDSASAISHLYGDLVAKYFPNLRTEYTTSGNPVKYYPGGDQSAGQLTALKLQVPYLVEYDKDRVVGGKPAPIVKDWIQDRGDGTFREYMTEWWWVKDLPGKKPGNQTDAQFAVTQKTQWAFADEALAKVDGFFGLAQAPVAPAAPTAAASGSDVTVSWTAPADGGSAVTGYRVSLDGGAAVTVAAPATSYTFAGVAAGSHTATVVAVNHLGASEASAASNAVRVAVASPSPTPSASATPAASPAPSASTTPNLAATGTEPTLAVTGSLQPGGRIVVNGAGLTANTPVRVELHSTPVVLGVTTTSAVGAFSLAAAIPANTPPGVHTVIVYVDGVQVAATRVTIAATALAATGGAAPAWGLLAGGLAASFAGLAIVVLARRRRTA